MQPNIDTSRLFLRSCRLGFMAIAMAALLSAPHEAVAKDTIKLGFLAPLSGGSADAGLGPRNAFLLAIDQANASDFPYHVEGVALDDAADPTTGVAAALKLVNDPQVVAATGHYNSGVALATTPVFHRSGIPFIVWGAISPKITEVNFPEVTRVVSTLLQENLPLTEAIVKKFGVKKVAIISDTTDYGVGNTAAFTEFFKAAGGAITSTDAAPTDTADYRAILTKVKAQAPEAIYYGGVYTEAGVVRKQMVELGMKIPMFGISGIYDTKLIEIAGPAADGVIAGNPAEQANPKMEEFQRAYKEHKFAEEAGPNARYAYDATNILLAAIRNHDPKDHAGVAKAIRAISYDGVLGRTTFDANGQTQIPVVSDFFIVKDGKWQKWTGK